MERSSFRRVVRSGSGEEAAWVSRVSSSVASGKYAEAMSLMSLAKSAGVSRRVFRKLLFDMISGIRGRQLSPATAGDSLAALDSFRADHPHAWAGDRDLVLLHSRLAAVTGDRKKALSVLRVTFRDGRDDRNMGLFAALMAYPGTDLPSDMSLPVRAAAESELKRLMRALS